MQRRSAAILAPPWRRASAAACSWTTGALRNRSLSSAGAADLYDDGALRVSRVDGKGYGVIAGRRFEKGALVLQEAPFARVNKDTRAAAAASPAAAALMERVHSLARGGMFDPADQESWPAEVVECLEGVLDIQAALAFAQLSQDAQQKWMQLQFVPLSSTRAGATPSPGRLLRTNAFDDAFGFANLYELCARMNHSCTPNTVRLSADNNAVKVMASRPIQVGEEVCISYLDTGTG
jgi:hypothetical protein